MCGSFVKQGKIGHTIQFCVKYFAFVLCGNINIRSTNAKYIRSSVIMKVAVYELCAKRILDCQYVD